MSRQNQKQLNDDVTTYINSLERGELCMSSVLMWLQENLQGYVDEDAQVRQVDSKKERSKHTGLSRLWIYSHHIYRKELLKKIPESARELGLTGFVLPGKPGIICVEGYERNCDDYWQRVKYPNWKHISCKHREDETLNNESCHEEQLSNFSLFTKFEELSFEAHGDYGLRNDYHMDLGQFFEFLKQHNCDYMFNIFFGLQGKPSSS